MQRKFGKVWVLAFTLSLTVTVARGQSKNPQNEPPRTQAMPAVQKVTDDAIRLIGRGEPSEALKRLDEAFELAKTEKDLAGEALVYKIRGGLFGIRNELEKSRQQWLEAAKICERLGDGPCRVEALAQLGSVLAAQNSPNSDDAIQQAIALARKETSRPSAAAEAILFGAQICIARRDLVHAEQLAGVALDLFERRDPRSVKVAESLNILAVAAYQQGKFVSAYQLFTREAQILAAYPEESGQMFASLRALGAVRLQRGERKESFEFYEWAIETIEKNGFDPPYQIDFLFAIAETEHRYESFVAANRHYEQAFKLQQKVKAESNETAEILVRWGRNLQEEGNLTEARIKIQAALDLNLAINPKTSQLASSLHYMGTILQDLGDLEGAKEKHQKALALRKILEPNSLAVAESLYELGFVTRVEGDVKAAGNYLREALSLQEKLAPNSILVALTLDNLAGVAFDLGDFLTAQGYDQRSLTIKKELNAGPLDLALSHNNLGLDAMMLGDLSASEQNLNEALKIKRRYVPRALTTAVTLDALSTLATSKNNHKLALDYAREALSIREKVAPNTIDLAGSLTNIGNRLLLVEGKSDEAKANLQRARDILRKVAPNSIFSATVFLGLALIAESENDLARAEELGKEAWRLIRRQSAALSGDELRQRFGSKRASLYAAQLVRWQILLKKNREALLTLEEGRAQALLQLLSERRAVFESTGGSLWSTHQQVLMRQHIAEEAMRKANLGYQAVLDELTEARKTNASANDLAKIDVRLQVKFAEFQKTQAQYVAASNETSRIWEHIKEQAHLSTPSIELDEAIKAVPKGAVFISFSVGAKDTYSFILFGANSSLSAHNSVDNGPLIKVSRVDEDQLRSLILAFKRKVANRNSDEEEVLRDGQALFELLFPEEVGKAVREAKQLIISPDGPLWELPFAALSSGAGATSQYLGLRVPILYAQSLTLFRHSQKEAITTPRPGEPYAVVVGNPRFSSNPRAPAQDDVFLTEREYLYENNAPTQLPGTAIEAQRVASLYKSRPLTDTDATELALRQVVERADVVHLATHGKYDQSRVMSSGILLAIAGEAKQPVDQNDDGVLQAWEIYSQLKLRAELVVLSACESGRGENVQGEGIVGLTRAFQYANARSVVASQWLVNDQSAQTIMIAFHQFLRQGKPKDQALQLAMRLTRNSSRAKHPYYWATFILLGDPVNHHLGMNKTQPRTRAK